MGRRFQELAFTPLVKEHQQEHGSRRQYERMEQSSPLGNTLGPAEQDFIQRRDSFYMASVSETGWPYVQHRGGRKGFVHILDPSLIGFADLRGNKQYISLGNLQHDARIALFFMDYPNQTRLKILGHVEVHEQDEKAAALIESFRPADKSSVVERVILIHVEAFDWNCPQHITPRYTIEELEESLAPVRERLAALEAENAALRQKLSPPKKNSYVISSTPHQLEHPTYMTQRTNIAGTSPFEPIIGFSRAVRIGNHVHVSGTGPVGADDGDVAQQADQCLTLIAAALKNAGSSLEHVYRTRIYLTHVEDWEAAGRIHGKFFGLVRPAATMVVVAALLNPKWRIEIEADAWIPE
jgi:uncharacterized protein